MDEEEKIWKNDYVKMQIHPYREFEREELKSEGGYIFKPGRNGDDGEWISVGKIDEKEKVQQFVDFHLDGLNDLKNKYPKYLGGVSMALELARRAVNQAEAEMQNSLTYQQHPDPEVRDDMVLAARSRVAKVEYGRLVGKDKESFYKEFWREIKRGGDKYPHDWMKKDTAMRKALLKLDKGGEVFYEGERYRPTILLHLMNYSYDLNRFNKSKSEQYEKERERTERLIGKNRKYKRRVGKVMKFYDYSVFVTDEGFYEGMMGVVNCSQGHLRKHINYCVEGGVFLHLGTLWKESGRGKLGEIYADGFWVRGPKGWRKHGFLKMNKHFKAWLRNAAQRIHA